MNAFRIIGIILALVGAIATVFPHWIPFLTKATEPTLDIFEAIERRVRAGMLLGVGLAFIGVTNLRPWSISIPSAIVYGACGALGARIFGIMVDGAVPKQWQYVAIEAVILTLAALWLWRSS